MIQWLKRVLNFFVGSRLSADAPESGSSPPNAGGSAPKPARRALFVVEVRHRVAGLDAAVAAILRKASSANSILGSKRSARPADPGSPSSPPNNSAEAPNEGAENATGSTDSPATHHPSPSQGAKFVSVLRSQAREAGKRAQNRPH